jgi:hypothetical protein
VSSADKPTSKTGDKESDMPPPLFDNKNTSDKHNGEVTFEEFDFTHSEHDLSINQNYVNTLDEKKADPSTDEGVDKIEEKDKPNKSIIRKKKRQKRQPPPLHLRCMIYSHTKGIVWTTSQLMVLYLELDMHTRSIGIFLLSKSCLIMQPISC